MLCYNNVLGNHLETFNITLVVISEWENIHDHMHITIYIFLDPRHIYGRHNFKILIGIANKICDTCSYC